MQSLYTIIMSTLLLSSTTMAQGIDRSNQFVFKTELKGYTCERWGQKGFKQSSLEENLGYSFVTLDISRDTRRSRINMAKIDSDCSYTALFDRKKGDIFLTFASSTVKDEMACAEMKADLDEFFAEGWNYEIKMNKYLSVEFPTGISSKCDETTGKSFARFSYNVML